MMTGASDFTICLKQEIFPIAACDYGAFQSQDLRK